MCAEVRRRIISARCLCLCTHLCQTFCDTWVKSFSLAASLVSYAFLPCCRWGHRMRKDEAVQLFSAVAVCALSSHLTPTLIW